MLRIEQHGFKNRDTCIAGGPVEGFWSFLSVAASTEIDCADYEDLHPDPSRS